MAVARVDGPAVGPELASMSPRSRISATGRSVCSLLWSTTTASADALPCARRAAPRVLALLQLAVAGEDEHPPPATCRRLAHAIPSPSRCPSPASRSWPRSREYRHRDGRRGRRVGEAERAGRGSRRRPREHGVEARDVVALGGEVHVAVGIRRSPWRACSSPRRVQPHDDIHRAEARPEVAGPACFTARAR